MSDTVPIETETGTAKSGLRSRAPIFIVGAIAVLGFVFLRDYISFQALSENRETLIAFRDANYVISVLGFIAILSLIHI